MPGHTITRLHRTVTLMLNIDRYGGRLYERDDSTIILKDYRCMSMRQLDLIHEQFPHVDITVQSHHDSASGFVVIFVLRDNPSMLRTSTFAQAVMFSVLLAATLSYEFIYSAFFLVKI
jgi:hypothetical protein